MNSVYTDITEIEAALPDGENPLPFFRNPVRDTPVQVSDSFPPRYKTLIGSETGYRILPYTKQDRYGRRRERMHIPSVVLENDMLKAVFFPGFGARLVSLVSKKDGRELVYRNDVFQPANLAIRNAWFSGGIEWNVGQYGHAFSTCSPVFCAKMTDGQGNSFLRVYDYERCKNIFWHIDFHLPENSAMLYAHTCIHNLSDSEIPMYYWTNIAVKQTECSRVFSPSADVVYIDPFVKKGDKRFGFGRLPVLDIVPDIDSSYPAQSRYANEYFFMCDSERMPWEAAVEKDGTGLLEISTDRLKYRKMFCWGKHAGGKHWGSFLGGRSETGDGFTEDTDGQNGSYYEIQAGLAPTQLHGIRMEAASCWSWTEGFGELTADPAQTHGTPWNEAQKHVASRVAGMVSASGLYLLDEQFGRDAALPCRTGDIIYSGSGWGALEAERRRFGGEVSVPVYFLFPSGSVTETQRPWFHLLEKGTFPAGEPSFLSGSFVMGAGWEKPLLRSLPLCRPGKEGNLWNTYLHLGIIAMEKGKPEEAGQWWQKSVCEAENVMAYRNLAVLAETGGDTGKAAGYYRKALQAPDGMADMSVAEEYLVLLVREKKYEKALAFYRSLPEEWRGSDTLLIQYGFITVMSGDIEEAEKVLRHDFANIREGECPLMDIWFEAEAVRRSRREGVALTDCLRRDVRENAVPPFRLDFRMF